MPTDPFVLNATILGSGTSQGVPMIGCACEVCRSTDPRDKRTRSSIFIKTPEAHILVDTTPDLRQQALREGLTRVDAVLFTHHHADHVMGFDDLRRFCDAHEGALPVYGSAETLQQIERIFHYAFRSKKVMRGYVHVAAHQVADTFTLGGLEITPLPVPHGTVSTYGYLFCRDGRKVLAYISDCFGIPEPVRKQVENVEVLIIDGLRDQPHPTHLTVNLAVEASKAIGAQKTYLTHQAHDRKHAERAADLPSGIDVAYDGMKLEFVLG